jgi:hypothetical protein
VLHLLLLPLLIRRDDEPAAGIGELDGATLALPEMLRADLAPIDQRDRQPVGDPGAELLHQVKRQRWPVRAFRVQEADERVETDRSERRDAVVPHETVEEAQEAVDPVARRTSRAGGEAEILALLLQEKAEDTKVLLAGEPFAAAQGIERAVACEIAGGQRPSSCNCRAIVSVTSPRLDCSCAFSGQVRVLVREIADERVDIRPPQPLDDLQPRPPIAEEVVVEEAERQCLGSVLNL